MAATWLLLLLWAIVHATVSFIGAHAARRHALRHGLLDQPGVRRSHVVPTPRGGGIGIAASWLLACAWLALLPGNGAWLAAGLAGAMLCVAGIGWSDDRRPLPVPARLVAQLAGAALAGLGFWAVTHSLPLAIAAGATVMVMVNVWNFMDGIDGLAATQGVIAALALGAWGGTQASLLLGLALAGACVGFLPLNLPKARLFLGDVGSGAIGLGIAVLLVMAARERSTSGNGVGAAAIVLLPVAMFLVDATLTLAGRIVRGEQWWTPHVEHAYQKLVARGRLHVRVTIAYGVASIAAVSSGLAVSGQGIHSQLGVVVVALLAMTLGWCWVQWGRTAGLTVQGPRK